MQSLLDRVLTEHGIAFESAHNVITPAVAADPARLVALLRQVLSLPAREAVRIIQPQGEGFPVPVSVENWWGISQTPWFDRALAEERFETWFQPVMDTWANEILGHECLTRLTAERVHAGSEILEAARVRGQLRAFDNVARPLAVRSAARQSAQGVYFVKLFPSSVYDPDFCLRPTLEAVERSGLAPASIAFEVMEPGTVRDAAHIRRIACFLRVHGFRIALDDMGTASETPRLMCDLRPDYLRLPKQMAQNVEQPLYGATVRKIVELAERAGTQLIAEGVESVQNMENLWLLGVRFMQGYLFGRPAPTLASPKNDVISIARAVRRVRPPALQAVN